MNFTTFPVASTNIFPAANSKNGGQLATEYNLRSREMVGTSKSISYEVGPSYVHSSDDFKVRLLSDDAGVVSSTSVLEILPGRGVINGHFVNSLSSMTIDLVEANIELKSKSKAPLSGKLAIGIRAFYASEQTVAGSILVENEDLMYQGIQLVVLPEKELITPIESPTDQSLVTAHLRLATFTFANNRITNIINKNDEKCQYISADRIANIDMMLSDSYVRKTGLNSKKLYAFAGKGVDPSTGYDTWEDVTDSMVVWDTAPQRTSIKPTATQATFACAGNKVYLVAPHKQVDGMKDAEGNYEYYAPRYIPLPPASYTTNTPGVIDRDYTSHIKEIETKVEQFRTTLTGKQIEYIEIKQEDTVLPPINSAWDDGDYILVGQDYTVDEANDGVRAPSTMYVVLPGIVQSILFVAQVDDSDVIPSSLSGCQIGSLYRSAQDGDARPGTSDPTTYPTFYAEEDSIRGAVNADYFMLTYVDGNNFSKYYYKVATAGPRSYSNAVLLTGEIPLAQEEVIGGFLNVSPDNIDSGYVYRDEYGRLRLVDYSLLRSGTLAYQLGQNITFPTGLSNEDIQTYLEEYVNYRVAFPNSAQQAETNPEVIHLYITFSAQETESSVTIGNIDSRFNSSIYLHILGDANSNTTINIVDCEKVRIDNDISGSPVINVYRSCIFYDPYVFNYIRQAHQLESFTGFEGITLWYQMYEADDPNLLVDYMTVSELDAPVIPEDIDYWNTTEANDNHYLTALNSITFSGDGTIVRCGLLVANQSTDNVDPGEKIVVGQFELPQGSGLAYPKACMTKQLKIVGTFTSAYYSEETWYTTNTTFGAITTSYDPYNQDPVAVGTIAFHSNTTLIRADVGATSIPVWETDTYSLFYGGAIS